MIVSLREVVFASRAGSLRYEGKLKLNKPSKASRLTNTAKTIEIIAAPHFLGRTRRISRDAARAGQSDGVKAGVWVGWQLDTPSFSQTPRFAGAAIN